MMIKGIKQNTYKTEVTSANHCVVSDELKNIGGTDMGVTPMEHMESSLASSITLRMYADRKKWDVVEIQVEANIFTDVKTKDKFIKKAIRITGELDTK